MKRFALFFIAGHAWLFLCSPPLHAAWVWSPEAGEFVNPDAVVEGTPQEQYDYAMESYKQKDLKKAAEQFRLLLRQYPSSSVAPEGQFKLGVIYEEMGDYIRAFRAYRDLLQRYPQTERMHEAIEREFRIGNLFLSGRRGKVLGLSILPSTPKAIEVFKHIVETAPYSEHGDRAQFHLGLAYKKAHRFDEAIQAYQSLIDHYPQSRLVPQARFQIADSSYLQSVVATRDQRVIDRAGKEIDQFLKTHPDSSVSDKAAKLRQEIDEKNAEKNYRIGLFYEKENYLDSAFIYYRDVTTRYPYTLWGAKAGERLKALEKPDEFLKSQEKEVQAKKQNLLNELQSLDAADVAQRKEMEGELKRLEKEEKEIQKSKPTTLKRRRAALRQKETDLVLKRKNLAKKKKHFSKNPSDDLLAAFERWEASLEKEQADLMREKMLIEGWEKNLDVSTAPFYASLIPFGKEPSSPVEEVRQVEAKRLAELAKEKVKLLKEKETAYREYEKGMPFEGLEGEAAADTTLQAERARLEKQRREIEPLEEKLKEKEALYEKYFGTSPWQAAWKVPKNVVTRPLEAAVGILNPFNGSGKKDWISKSAEELKTLQSHWKEKIAAQKTLVDTIGHAFDTELAQAEEKRLLENVPVKESDPQAMRRAVKQLEREIRRRYNEIQDRNERKSELLGELEKTFRRKEEDQGSMAKGGRMARAPVTGLYKFGKAFLFGLSSRDVKLTEEAKRVAAQSPDSVEIQNLRKEIELESLLIQTRSEEIQRMTRELDALQARASLSGTPAFRSLLIKFPYVFVREAIASARRVIPEEDREAKLIEQLNEETQKLEELKRGLQEIDAALRQKALKEGGAVQTEKTEPVPPIPAQEKAVPPADPKALRDEIRTLQKQLEFQGKNYERELEAFEKSRRQKLGGRQGKPSTERLQKIENALVEFIEKEQKIHQEESRLLLKKREAAENFLSQLPGDIFTEQLTGEKKEIEARLDEIQKRQTTLGEEARHLRPESLPPASS